MTNWRGRMTGRVLVLFMLLLLPAAWISPRAAAAPGDPPQPKSPTIVGGTEAAPGTWPWQAAIVDAAEADVYMGQYCGGTLIAAQWVLSAAHCFFDENSQMPYSPDQVDVVVGRHRLSSSDGQRLGVSQVIIHPNYLSSNTNQGDVALLKLEQAATLSSDVAVVPLATSADAALTAPGVQATVTGWGLTSNNGEASDALREVNIPIVDNQVCNQAGLGPLAESHLCAGGEGGKDSCNGDSGGPLVVPDAQHTGYLQAGIVSYGGEQCAVAGMPGVYERVSSYATWISQQMGGNSELPTDGYFTYLPLVLR